jgi:hypothetical protein
VAVIAAGLWALFQWGFNNVPSLTTQALVTTDVTAEDDWGGCKVRFRVKVKNEGIVGFDVKKVHLQVWQSDILKPDKVKARLFDGANIEHNGEPLAEDMISSGYLVRHFPPKYDAAQDFYYVLSLRPRRLFVFRAELQDAKGQVLAFGRAVRDKICIGEETTNPQPGRAAKTPEDLLKELRHQLSAGQR